MGELVQEIVARIEQIAESVAAPAGIEIVEVELLGGGKARLLRIYIDKPGGVTHSDCELVSRQVGDLLDEADIIDGDSYHLEVSSPGVERKLSKPRDFERFTGQKVKVEVKQPIEGQRRFEGILTGFDGSNITIERTGGEALHFSLSQVAKANLKFEW